MSDQVLAYVLLASFFAALAAARAFKTLETDFGRAALPPFLSGLAIGIALLFVEDSAPYRAVAVGLGLTLAALYVRLVGVETEPAEGMLIGAIAGAAAAIPHAFTRIDGPRAFTECVIAGTVAGYGITFGAFHVSDRLRQLATDALTAVLAVGGAALPRFADEAGLTQNRLAIGVAAAVPLLSVLTVFAQAGDVRRELEHECSNGLIDDDDVRGTAHPLRRLGRGGWADPKAHRQFVRLANRIALRRRQQRHRSGERARIYEVEIIKLRMQLQEMTRIGRLERDPSEEPCDDLPSDRMRS